MDTVDGGPKISGAGTFAGVSVRALHIPLIGTNAPQHAVQPQTHPTLFPGPCTHRTLCLGTTAPHALPDVKLSSASPSCRKSPSQPPWELTALGPSFSQFFFFFYKNHLPTPVDRVLPEDKDFSYSLVDDERTHSF